MEDKAEIYSFIFAKGTKYKLEIYAKQDPDLNAKVEYLKSIMNSKVSKMDDTYFKNLLEKEKPSQS